MTDIKITNYELETTDVSHRADSFEGSAQENKEIFDALPKLIAQKHNSLADFLTENIYTKEQTEEKINQKVVDIGTGDMAMAVYDHDGSGSVENAKKLGGKPPEYYASQTDLGSVAEIAANAVPKTGGSFTGEVTACDTNRSSSCLRNIAVKTVSPEAASQSTNAIIMVRK